MKYRSSGRMAVLASTLLASASTVALAGEVTSDRLLNADKEPQNWLMVNKDYAATATPARQINRDNVKNLKVAFTPRSAAPSAAPIDLGGHQATPLVDDGWMYVVDGYGAVYKIDVRDPAARSRSPGSWIRASTRPRCGSRPTAA